MDNRRKKIERIRKDKREREKRVLNEEVNGQGGKGCPGPTRGMHHVPEVIDADVQSESTQPVGRRRSHVMATYHQHGNTHHGAQHSRRETSHFS